MLHNLQLEYRANCYFGIMPLREENANTLKQENIFAGLYLTINLMWWGIVTLTSRLYLVMGPHFKTHSLYSVSHRIANRRATASSRLAPAVRMSAGVDTLCWVTSGRRKQASERARNTKQQSSMSRKELNVGLAKVCTGAWVST